MKKLLVSWKYSVLARWILTGSIVLLIPVVCSLLGFGFNKNLLERKIGQVNHLISKDIQQSIDNKITDIINITQHIYIDNDFSANKLNVDDEIQFHRMIDNCYEKLQVYKVANSEIEIFIYLPEKEFLLTTSTANNIRYIYNTLKHKKVIDCTLDEWKEHIMAIPSNIVSISSKLSYKNYGKENFIYVMKGSSTSVTRSPLICVSINTDFIVDVLENERNHQYAVLLADSEGKIVANYGAEIVLPESGIDTRMVEENVPFSFGSEKEYMATYAESDICDWKYIVCTPKAEYMNEVRDNTILNLVIISVGLIIGIVSMTMLQRYNYRPVKHLTSNILVADEQSDMDAFALVEQNIKKLYQENASMRNSLDNKKEREKEWYFLAELKGYKSYVQKADLCELMGCKDKGSRYLLVTIDMEPTAISNREFVDDFSLLTFAVQNVVEELFTDKCRYLKTMDEMFIVYLFAIDKAEEWPVWLLECKEKMCSLCDFFQKWFHIDLEVTIGEKFEVIDNIAINYEKIMKKNECRKLEKSVREEGEEQNGLADEIREYVLKNYADCNLNISSIAQDFQMSPRYISRLFKEQSGTGLIDYINQVRIRQAEELLKNTSKTVDEITMRVGYTNSRTFRRNFQKITGKNAASYKRKQ